MQGLYVSALISACKKLAQSALLYIALFIHEHSSCPLRISLHVIRLQATSSPASVSPSPRLQLQDPPAHARDLRMTLDQPRRRRETLELLATAGASVLGVTAGLVVGIRIEGARRGRLGGVRSRRGGGRSDAGQVDLDHGDDGRRRGRRRCGLCLT